MSAKSTELIIYIAEQLKDSPNYGATLLNKTLYYVDLMQYLTNGSTITDFQYVNQNVWAQQAWEKYNQSKIQ
jgi:hypothetical protein